MAGTDHVILGGAGQLGQAFARKLGQRAVPLARDQADLTRPQDLRRMLADLRPRVVLNCAAYNHVDRAEKEPSRAYAVNASGVAGLAQTCAALDCTLVHFGTDYVFGQDRDRSVPYTEADTPGPLNVYGHSKLAGELAVEARCSRHFVIRTCGLYGPPGTGGKGGNFVATMLRLAGGGDTIRVVQDQICCPTLTTDLAEATLALVRTGDFGLYHVVNTGAISWLEFARLLLSLAGVKANLQGVTSGQLGRPAARPRYSVLRSEKLPPMRSIQEALAAHLRESKS